MDIFYLFDLEKGPFSPDLRKWKIIFLEKRSYGHETQNNVKISDFWEVKKSHLLNMEGAGYTYLAS